LLALVPLLQQQRWYPGQQQQQLLLLLSQKLLLLLLHAQAYWPGMHCHLCCCQQQGVHGLDYS
jgi:hypothetical protein